MYIIFRIKRSIVIQVQNIRIFITFPCIRSFQFPIFNNLYHRKPIPFPSQKVPMTRLQTIFQRLVDLNCIVADMTIYRGNLETRLAE